MTPSTSRLGSALIACLAATLAAAPARAAGPAQDPGGEAAPAQEAAPAGAPPPRDAAALAVRPPGPEPIPLHRPVELRDLIPGDDPLHRRAVGAAERKQGAVAFAAVAAVSGALVLPFLMFDLVEHAASGESRRVPRFFVPLAVSVGSGGVFLGLNASADREARAVAEAWNAAHPERPVDWRP